MLWDTSCVTKWYLSLEFACALECLNVTFVSTTGVPPQRAFFVSLLSL